MHKFIKALAALILINISAHATHITGGDIQYRYVGDSTGIAHHYEITLRVYRDCSPGTSTFISGQISIESSCYATQNVTLPQINGPLANGEFPPPTYEDCVNQGTVKCLGIRLFKGLVTLPGLCSDFKFVYDDCCRPGGVDNLVNSISQGFYFEAKLNNFLGNNSSAKFVSEPARAFCIGNNFNWNQAVIELDGDSLRYELIPARDWLGGAALPYNSGYSPQQPMTTIPAQSFSLNANTGNMNFTPGAIETVVIALEVKEYRFDSTYFQWVQIGSSNRELVASVAANCSPLAQQGVLLDYNAPGIYIDPNNGLPTVDYTCLDSSVVLQFAVKLDCSTISPDGTDFRLTAPDGQPIPIKELVSICDVNNETDEILVKLHKPLSYNGDYYIYSKIGNDGNTLLNKCGFPMAEFDTIQLHVEGCFTTNIDLKNVSIVNDEYPQIEWLLDTIGTATAPFPTYLVDQYKVYRQDPGQTNYFLLYTINNYKNMTFNDKSLGWPDVDANTYKYRVEVVVNSKTEGPTRNIHSILLKSAIDPNLKADSIDLSWNNYNGWPGAEYYVELGTYDPDNGVWNWKDHLNPNNDPANPSLDSAYMMINQGLQPGDYAARIRAEYPGGSGPYTALSNWIRWTIYEPPVIPPAPSDTLRIPNVITPNGDGNNDLFKIDNIDTWPTTRSVTIFNRWGGIVYQTDSYSNANPWDGTDQTGKQLADGVYFYTIEVFNQPTNKRETHTGTVTILTGGAN